MKAMEKMSVKELEAVISKLRREIDTAYSEIRLFEIELRKRPKFKIGDPVKFNAPTGSTGKIVHVRKDGPFAEEPRYYVTWIYGLDVKGEPMTSLSGLMDAKNLVPISEADYQKIATRKGFGS